MTDEIRSKLKSLEDDIRGYGKLAIAFSAGVDSSFLLKVAHSVLGDGVIALTADSAMFPERELDEAKGFCQREGIRHIVFSHDEMSIEGFKDNPVNRCYLCKSSLFKKIRSIALENGIENIAEGSNLDDDSDYRPGLKAIKELGILSPLRKAGLKKEDIRILSREMGLPTWDKPSFACLASRFVYGERISGERLAMVDKAEQKLHELGFGQVRVRVHGDLARIEVEKDRLTDIIEDKVRNEIDRYFNELGFSYVSLDLGGYKSGSMNRTLEQRRG